MVKCVDRFIGNMGNGFTRQTAVNNPILWMMAEPLSLKIVRKDSSMGAVYAGVWHIPYAGVVIAPILAVVAGTITVHKMVDLTQNQYALRPGQETLSDIPEDAPAEGDESVEVEIEA